jgi:hypothetical protein
MKLNLHSYLQTELDNLVTIMRNCDGWKQIDCYTFESTKLFGGKEIILVFYPELLTYGYVYFEGAGVYDNGKNRKSEDWTTPWIACRVELEGEQNTPWHHDVLKELKEWAKEKLPWQPFFDEDACYGIYSRQCSAYSRDWTEYIFYINPDYPKGWWENHTLG